MREIVRFLKRAGITGALFSIIALASRMISAEDFVVLFCFALLLFSLSKELNYKKTITKSTTFS